VFLQLNNRKGEQVMERKYFFLEMLVLLGGILSVCLIGVCIEIIFPIKLYKSITVMCLVTFVVGTYFAFLKYVKSMGFYCSKISPLIYEKNINYNDVLKTFEVYFKSIHNYDENSSYIIAKRHGLKILITVMKFDDFNRDAFKKRKNKINRFINKRHNLKRTFSLATSYNKIKINFIVVDDFDEYCKELIFCNANNSFSRIECVLNVVLLEKKGILYIPAHFGLDKFNEYYKTVKLLKKIFQIS